MKTISKLKELVIILLLLSATTLSASVKKWGDGVNLQPSYYNSGNVDMAWELMKQYPKIKTVRIEIEPDEGVSIETAGRWIEEANAHGFNVIATYHDWQNNGSDDESELLKAANWWKTNYDSLAKRGNFTINLMNEWGSHQQTPASYSKAYNNAIDVVREKYAGPLIIDLAGWAQETTLAREVSDSLRDNNIIYSAHIYPGAYVGYSSKGGHTMTISDLDTLEAAGRPVIIGEFGSIANGSADWSALVDHAKSKGWTVIGWAWNGDGEGMNMTSPMWPNTPTQTTSYFDIVYDKLTESNLDTFTIEWGDGVNLQPSYYNSGNVDMAWELMKQYPKIKTVRIEIEPDEGVSIETAGKWIEEANAHGFNVIATYHDWQNNGSDDESELLKAANWWKTNYDSLAKRGNFTINLMNEWGSHQQTPASYSKAYNNAIDVVREKYAGPLIIDLAGWAQETTLAREVSDSLRDNNIIYSAHIYPGAYVGYSSKGGHTMTISDLDTLEAAGRPVIIGEFGSIANGSADWSALVDHAKSKGWTVIGWAWNGDGEGMNMTSPMWPNTPIQTTSYFDTIYNKLSNADLIEENVFPIAEAGLDQTIMCSDSIEDVIITLDGSESNDSDGFIRSYVWSENEKILATGVNSTVELKVGVHEIVLLVTDNEGGTASDTMIVNIKLADDLTTYYYLENKGSRNMRLKVQNSVNGSALLMCPESTEGWEAQWEKVTSGNYFYFKNRWTGMSFQPESAEDGSIIIQQDKITEEEWAQWSEDISNEGYFYLRNRKTNKYIRPINGENNSPIELRPSSYKGDYTKWRFVAVESSLKNGIKDENIEENIKDLFVIYPNPAMDNLNVKFSLKQEDQVTIEIYNTSGQKFIVKQLGWLDRGGCNINLKVGNAVNMCPGIYCVMIKTSKTRVSRYVVIK